MPSNGAVLNISIHTSTIHTTGKRKTGSRSSPALQSSATTSSSSFRGRARTVWACSSRTNASLCAAPSSGRHTQIRYVSTFPVITGFVCVDHRVPRDAITFRAGFRSEARAFPALNRNGCRACQHHSLFVLEARLFACILLVVWWWYPILVQARGCILQGTDWMACCGLGLLTVHVSADAPCSQSVGLAVGVAAYTPS